VFYILLKCSRIRKLCTLRDMYQNKIRFNWLYIDRRCAKIFNKLFFNITLHYFLIKYFRSTNLTNRHILQSFNFFARSTLYSISKYSILLLTIFSDRKFPRIRMNFRSKDKTFTYTNNIKKYKMNTRIVLWCTDNNVFPKILIPLILILILLALLSNNIKNLLLQNCCNFSLTNEYILLYRSKANDRRVNCKIQL